MKLTSTLFVLRTVNSFGWSASNTFFAVYLEVVRHVALGVIGAVYLAGGVFWVLGQLLGGWLTDLYGSKSVMCVGYASSVLYCGVTAYMLWASLSVAPILALYVALSVPRAFSNPATAALIASQKQRTQVASGFSLQTMGANIGFGLGPAVGGFLSQTWGYPALFVLSACSAALTLALAAALVRPQPHEQVGGRPRPMLPARLGVAPTAFLATVTLLFFLNGYIYTPLSLYAAGFAHLSNFEIGLLFTLNGLLIVVLQIPLVRLLEASGQMGRAAAYSALLMAAAFLLVAHTGAFGTYVAAMATATVGEILLTVPTQLAATALSDTNNRGSYQGYYSASMSAGRSLATFVAPLSFQLVEPPSLAWDLVSALCLVASLTYLKVSGWAMAKQPSRKEAQSVRPA